MTDFLSKKYFGNPSSPPIESCIKMPESWTLARNNGFKRMDADSKNTGGEISLRLKANYAEQDLFADIKFIFICNKEAR
jgi:hypothetical protein